MLYNMTNNSTCIEAQSLVASVLTPMLILDFVLGLPGNILALWLLGFKAPWKPANIYLLNLAVADTLLLIALPFRIDSVLRGSWVFGDPFCRINFFMLSVNQSASIAFMTVLAVDRFYRIVHPHHPVCHLSIKKVVMVSCGVWVAVVTLRLPLLLIRLLRSSGNPPKLLCQNIDIWTDTGAVMRVHNSFSMIEFALAFILVTISSVRICYNLQGNKKLIQHRRVKRTIYLLLTVMIMFILCFLPCYVTGFVAFFLGDVSSCSSYIVVGQVFSVSLCFVFLNSALDPVLYTLSSTCFRDSLKEKSNSTGLTKFQLSIKETRAPQQFWETNSDNKEHSTNSFQKALYHFLTRSAPVRLFKPSLQKLGWNAENLKCSEFFTVYIAFPFYLNIACKPYNVAVSQDWNYDVQQWLL